MSQDDRNYQITSGLLSGFTSNQPNKLCLVETNSSYWVGKGFKELELNLNQSFLLMPVLKVSETRTWQSVYQSDTVVTALSTSVQSLLVVPYPQQTERLSVVASTSCLLNDSTEQRCQSDWFLSSSQPVRKRFLYCLMGASLAMTLLLWMGSQVKLTSERVAPPISVASQKGAGPQTNGAINARLAPPLNQAHSSSLGESLTSMNKNQQPVKQSASAKRATQPSKVPLPTKPRITSTVVPVPTRAKAERVYVPVYQSPPSQKRQVTSKPQTVKASSPSVSSGASTHTLIGVFEFGDRSAALVNINQITRRISIGEMLTPGSWKLTKVEGQKVVLQRRGKLRTIYVGQSF